MEERDFRSEIYKMKDQLNEKCIKPAYIVVSEEIYLVFCAQLNRLFGWLGLVDNFDGMKIVIIPGVKNYIKVVPDNYTLFEYAFGEKTNKAEIKHEG